VVIVVVLNVETRKTYFIQVIKKSKLTDYEDKSYIKIITKFPLQNHFITHKVLQKFSELNSMTTICKNLWIYKYFCVKEQPRSF